MTEWHSPHKERCQSLAAILLIMLLRAGPGHIYALDASASSGTVQHRVIPLTHIAPQRGKEFLTRLKIGTASRLPGTDTLLVTGGPGELQKAIAILGLVDTVTEFDIKQLGPVSAAGMMPSNERIADAVGGISLGTFANPPRDKTRMRGILDVHNGAVVAIAPAFQLKDITTAVELGPEAVRRRRVLAAPVNPAAVTPTIQATAMGDPASDQPADETGDPQPAPADKDESKESTLLQEMQRKLEEVRRRAAELTARAETPSSSDESPVPAPTPGSRPAGGVPSAVSEAGAAEPQVPAGFQQVGAAPQDDTGLQTAPEPATDTAGLRPGEIVPSDSERVAQPPARPESADVMAAAQPTAQPKSAASFYEPAEFPNGDELIELTLPDKVQVIQLLDLIGKYLNLSYVYDPQKVTGEVTLKLNGNLRGRMKVKDLYLLLESVLQFKDLVMTRHKGNIVKIVPKAEYMSLDPDFVSPEAPPVEAGDVVITRVFELKHIDTASAENLLQGMGLTIGITPIAESKTLIVTSYAHRMGRIEHLLELVDRPGEPREFKYRQLKYTMAKTLAEKVKALAEQLESVTVTVGEPDVTPTITRAPGESDAAYRTRVAQIRAAQAQLARTRALQGMQQPDTSKQGVYLDADERTNRILMIGLAKQLDVVDGLVDSLDVQQQDLRALQLYRIKHIDAEEMARKLQELGIISRLPDTYDYGYGSSRITGRGRTTGTVPGQPRVPTAPTPESQTSSTTEVTEKGLVEEPQVVVVESTNSLLVNATAEQHAKIANIIEYVDSEMLLDEIPYKIYPLENSSPGHLAEILESLIQETIEQEREGKIEKTVVSREEKVKIVPDPNTYSLIVYGNKKNQEWIATLVEQLDKRRPQVLIDCTLVEVTKSDAFSYDLNVLKTFNGPPGIGDPNGLGKYVEWAGGTLTAFYGDDQIQALLRTMQTKNYGRVLAKPKLLVNDNELGKIETVDTTYVEVTSAIPVATGAAGPQNTLVQTSVNFNPYEAGISLDITPHISEGDLLRLDVVLTRSDFLKTPAVGPNQQQPPPNTRTNTVDTKVTLPNSSTVILGGLTKMNQTKGGSKVPILGDIPIIGGLFRSIDNEDTQSKLYVFVKAEVIRPAETAEHGMKDLERLSERNRTAFEKHELEFQNYQNWPGIKPKRIDPPKVLDAQ